MSNENQVPDWMWERYLLDELPRKKRRQLAKMLEHDPALRARLEKLRLDDRQILGAYPPERMIPEILKRAALDKPRPASPRRWRLAWAAAPALALAVLLLLILPPLLQRRMQTSESQEYIGLKGDGAFPRTVPRLQVYRRVGDRSELLRDGDPARAGDLLQVAFIAAGRSHGVILSIDGSGAVTLHFPEAAEGDTTLARGSMVPLPRAYELDDSPGFERFIFIASRGPLPVAAILEKARVLAADRGRAATGSLDLPADLQQFSLLVRK